MRKTVLVTGASHGIGRAAAEAFAVDGCRVAVNYKSSEAEALELVEKLRSGGCDAEAFHADVAEREQVKSMFQKITARFGTVDILVNNAGIAQEKLFSDITETDWDTMMNVHVKGMFHCCQLALPRMIHRKAGKIINISSIWGLVGGSCEVHYSTAKAAVIGFTRALAKEVGPSNIQVNCVAPGIINTRMNQRLNEEEREALREETPLQRFGTPAEVANAILFLASDKADFITGQVLSPNGGFVI